MVAWFFFRIQLLYRKCNCFSAEWKSVCKITITKTKASRFLRVKGRMNAITHLFHSPSTPHSSGSRIFPLFCFMCTIFADVTGGSAFCSSFFAPRPLAKNSLFSCLHLLITKWKKSEHYTFFLGSLHHSLYIQCVASNLEQNFSPDNLCFAYSEEKPLYFSAHLKTNKSACSSPETASSRYH